MPTFWDLPTKTIDLGDGNTVTVRKLTFADAQKVWGDKSLYEGPAETAATRYAAAVLRLAISAWAGPGFEGRGVSPEHIDALPMSIINQLGSEAVEFCMLSDDEKKASTADTK